MSKKGCILTIELITTLPSKKSKELMVPFSNWFSTSPFGPQEQQVKPGFTNYQPRGLSHFKVKNDKYYEKAFLF